MKKNLKKVFAAGLAATMVMGTASVAMADTNYNLKTNIETENAEETVFTTMLKKTYTVNGATDENVYPKETLRFTSKPADTNPDVAKNLTIEDLDVSDNAENNLTFSLPQFENAGIYKFTITEDGENTQGVTYDTDAAITVSVLVSYDYEDIDGDKYHLEAETVTITAPVDEEGNKVDSITNIYDLGSLAINKTVTGNLGSQDDEFEVDVTFTSDQVVLSDISYDNNKKIVAYESEQTAGEGETLWVLNGEEYKAEVTITVSHGDTVTFTDIPAGVEYKIEEHDYTGGNDNTVNGGYDAAKYSTVSADDENVTETCIEGSIEAEDEDKAFIINNKGTEVNTGISLDNMPYLMMLAMTVLGAFGFVSKKRKEEEMF